MVFKNLPWLVLIFIARRFNELVELIYIPIQWKNIQLLLPKQDENHTFPLNCRAESLLFVYIYMNFGS